MLDKLDSSYVVSSLSRDSLRDESTSCTTGSTCLLREELQLKNFTRVTALGVVFTLLVEGGSRSRVHSGGESPGGCQSWREGVRGSGGPHETKLQYQIESPIAGGKKGLFCTNYY